MATRDKLHVLVDRLPEECLDRAEQALGQLAQRGLPQSAPTDDEEFTQRDAAAVASADRDRRAGRLIPHQDVVRNLGG